MEKIFLGAFQFWVQCWTYTEPLLQAICATVDGVTIQNFSTSFADGQVLCHLISNFLPQCLPRHAIKIPRNSASNIIVSTFGLSHCYHLLRGTSAMIRVGHFSIFAGIWSYALGNLNHSSSVVHLHLLLSIVMDCNDHAHHWMYWTMTVMTHDFAGGAKRSKWTVGTSMLAEQWHRPLWRSYSSDLQLSNGGKCCQIVRHCTRGKFFNRILLFPFSCFWGSWD